MFLMLGEVPGRRPDSYNKEKRPQASQGQSCILDSSSLGIQRRVQNMYASRPKIYFFRGLIWTVCIGTYFFWTCVASELSEHIRFIFHYLVWVSGLEICTMTWISDLFLHQSMDSLYSAFQNREGGSEMWILNNPCYWSKFCMNLLEKSWFHKVSYTDLWMNKRGQTKLPDWTDLRK